MWTDLAVIAGSASGALTGLLFVAVSLNRDRLAGHPALQSQAGVTLVLFLLPLITSMVLVIPGTPSWVLGLELVTIAIASAVIMGVISPGKPPEGDEPEAVLARLLARFSPNLLTMLLVLVAGAIELAGADGLYWLAPALIAALVTGVANAWLFLTPLAMGITSCETSAPSHRHASSTTISRRLGLAVSARVGLVPVRRRDYEPVAVPVPSGAASLPRAEPRPTGRPAVEWWQPVNSARRSMPGQSIRVSRRCGRGPRRRSLAVPAAGAPR